MEGCNSALRLPETVPHKLMRNEAEVILKYGQFNKSSTLILFEDIFESIS